MQSEDVGLQHAIKLKRLAYQRQLIADMYINVKKLNSLNSQITRLKLQKSF